MRACLRGGALLALGVAIATATAGGAQQTTVVSVTVPSATELTKTSCADGVTGLTSFGVVLPGSTSIGTADCVLTWGSSNDTSTLRIYQADRAGTAMFRPANGTMDGGFGGDGISDVVDQGGDDEVRALAVQSTGKVLLGTINSRVSRLNANGTLDTGFPGSGHLNVNAQVGQVLALLVDSADRIYVGGGNGGRAAVARYSSAGVLDTTWGSGGLAAYGPFQTSEALGFMAFDSAGRLVIAGRSNDGNNDVFVERLTTSGQLDTSFNAGTGYRVVQMNVVGQQFPTVAVAPDDSIYIGTKDSSNRGAIVKVTSAGAMATGFGALGIATADASGASEEIRGIAVHPDGDVVAVGNFTAAGSLGSLLVKLDGATGAPEATVGGGDGILDLDLQVGAEDVYRSIVIQPDGKLIVQGRADIGAPEGMELAVHRLTATGAFDTSFGGGDGQTFHHFTAGGSVDDRGSFNGELLISTDGSIIAAGETADPANAFAIRMLGTTFPDWLSGTNDWAVANAGAFATCLHTLGAPAIAQTWAVAGTNNCTTSIPANWHEVPASPTSIGRMNAAGTTTVNMRFGIRAASNQAPGDYIAPVAFEVTAP